MKKKQVIRRRKNRLKIAIPAGQRPGIKVLAVFFIGAGLIMTLPRLKTFFNGSNLFQVKTIEIEGVPSRIAEEIRKKAGIDEGMSIFSVDKKKIEKLISSMPGIESFKVRKLYPSKLAITMKEREVVARVTANGATHAIDRHGVLFEKDLEEVKKYPELSFEGADSFAGSMEILVKLYSGPAFGGQRNIERVVFTHSGVKIFSGRFCYYFDDLKFSGRAELDSLIADFEGRLNKRGDRDWIIDFRNFAVTGQAVVRESREVESRE